MQSPFLILSLVVIFGAFAASAPAHAQLTPESPEVRRMIAAGMKYLETAADGRLGGDCLIGLCHYKNSGDAKHPAVARAVAACGRVCRLDAEQINTDIYSTGIAIFFLCEVDAQGNISDIEKLVQSLILRQKAGGGWGYPSGTHAATGDTSMTQYAVLGLWAAKGHGVRVPDEVVVRVGDWLIRTQDPGGGWGYQGNDPGNFVKVKQAQVRKSLTAAGLGSAYICASMLGISNEKEDRSIEGLPAAFQRVEKPAEDGKAKPADLDPRRLRAAQVEGNRWFAQNFEVIDENWVYYYLYAFERYMSFRELVEGRDFDAAWYDRGAKFLAKAQHEDGRWQSNAGPTVDTAFAILFLMRGTQKTIQTTIDDTRQWTVVGGRGLPKNTSNLRVSGGKLVGTPLVESIEDLLAILENPNDENFDYTLEFPPPVDWAKLTPQKHAEYVRRWTGIAKEGPPAARKFAVETLARCGRVSVAPVLIDALGDGDLGVVLAARDGLRRLSRKFAGYGLSNRPLAEEIDVAQEQWRRWYESIPPE